MIWQKHLKKVILIALLAQFFLLNANFSDRIEKIRYHYAHGQIFSAFFKISEMPDSNLTDIDLLLKINIIHDYSLFTRQYDIYLDYFDTLEPDYVLSHWDELISDYNEVSFKYFNSNVQSHYIIKKLVYSDLTERQWALMLVTANKYGKRFTLNNLLQYIPVEVRLSGTFKVCLAYCFCQNEDYLKSSMLLNSLSKEFRSHRELRISHVSQLISELQTCNILYSPDYITSETESLATPLSTILLSFKAVSFNDSVLDCIENIDREDIRKLLLAYFYYYEGEPALAYDNIKDLESTEFIDNLRNRIVNAAASRMKNSVVAPLELSDSLNMTLPNSSKSIMIKRLNLDINQVQMNNELSVKKLRTAISDLNPDNDIFINGLIFVERLYLDNEMQMDYKTLKDRIHYRLKIGDYEKITELTDNFSEKYSTCTDSTLVFKYIALKGLHHYDEALTTLSELAVSTDNDSLKKKIINILPEITSKVSLENGADNLELILNDPDMLQHKKELFCTLAKHYENYNLFDIANRVYNLCLADSLCKMDSLMLSNITENMIRIHDYYGVLVYLNSFSDSISLSQRMKFNMFTSYYHTEQPDSAFNTMVNLISTTDPDSLQNEVLITAGNFFNECGILNLALAMYEEFLSRKFNVLNSEQQSVYKAIRDKVNPDFLEELKKKPINLTIKKEIERIKNET